MHSAATTIHMALMVSPRCKAMPPTAQAPTTATRNQKIFCMLVRDAGPMSSRPATSAVPLVVLIELVAGDARPFSAEQPAVAQLGLDDAGVRQRMAQGEIGRHVAGQHRHHETERGAVRDDDDDAGIQ